MATEIISSNIENELLVSFEKAADERDLEKMREFAHTLFDFNGGDSCVQRCGPRSTKYHKKTHRTMSGNLSRP